MQIVSLGYISLYSNYAFQHIQMQHSKSVYPGAAWELRAEAGAALCYTQPIHGLFAGHRASKKWFSAQAQQPQGKEVAPVEREITEGPQARGRGRQEGLQAAAGAVMPLHLSQPRGFFSYFLCLSW